MELTETIDTINRQLIDLFGIDTVTTKAMWRVTWAEDQYEMCLTECDDKGIYYAKPQVRLMPSYSWIKGRYILEHLVGVPEVNIPELPANKITYTNIWTFEDKFENYLPPSIVACKFVINLVESAMLRYKQGLSPIKKYIDEEYSQDASLEAKAKRLNNICEELYGEDAAFHDDLASGSGVVLSDKGRN